MFKKFFTLLLIFAALLLPNLTYAAEVQTEDSNKEIGQKLTEIKYHIDSVARLKSKKLLTEKQASDETAASLKEASVLLKKPVNSYEELLSAIENQNKTTGFFSFVTIIKVFSIIILAASLIWLSSLYLVPIILALSPKAKEAIFYSLSLTPILLAKFNLSFDIDHIYMAFLGCLGFLGAMEYSAYSRKLESRTFLYALLTIVWAAVAFWFNSSLIGFIAVGAFLTTLGFSALVTPLCYCIGFRDDHVMARATAAAAILVATYVSSEMCALILPVQAQLFKFGVLFLGSFVYFTGLLIMSSKYYAKTTSSYFLMQIITVASGIAALLLGFIYNIPTLQKIGGTFFFLYFVEKYSELPWDSSSWPWLSLIFGGLLWGAARFASVYPTYFFFF